MTLVPDCCFSILSDIDGSLANVHKKHSLVLVSCTTISVYVNLSKSVLQKERIKGRPPHQRGGFTSFAAAKVRLFQKLTKLSQTFFKKRCVFELYTLYI